MSTPLPSPDLLHDIARSVSAAGSLEELTRGLLDALETVTGLESTYLTRIDAARQIQEVLYSHNTHQDRIDIPEGLSLAWDDTVCKRAMEQEIVHTQAADDRWGDNQAIQDLGIRTYLGQPIWGVDGALLGTLCGVSDRRVPVAEDTLHVVNLFTQLIAHQMTREQVQADLGDVAGPQAESETTDALTGIPNHRAMALELDRALAQIARGGGRVLVALVDLDAHGELDERYSADTGEHFLINMAGRLAAATRVGEFLAHYGRNRFVVIVRTDAEAGTEADAGALRERLARATRGSFVMGTTVLQYPGAQVGVAVSTAGDDVQTLLERADEAVHATPAEAGADDAPAPLPSP